jgi:hypothetical protein
VTYQPPPAPCCLLGQVYFDAYDRARRGVATGTHAGPLVVSQLVEVVDHLVTMHGAEGPEAVDGCAGCARFAGDPSPGTTLTDWLTEARAHRVAHTIVDGGPLQLAA